ncbi:hypothetical protein ACCQ13_14850 [Xanthomonas sp. NCPPB 1638]|uniref:hypothetical protein n=1 Tax=Xanthomonas TaxID=338 RepID=UPI00132F1D9D|nr:hypothetical protein [Xanthomonas cucurbitae]QHG87963.1 hypothetical protein EBN15_14495 [Xanthomonas cucurbitae]
MSGLRLEVPCYGETSAVLSKHLNRATGSPYWIAEIYCDAARAQLIQLVVIIGKEGSLPRFEVPSERKCAHHTLWLDQSCMELPPASWEKLKIWANSAALATASESLAEARA